MDPNPGQARAIEHEGHALVSACPGSGKTSALARRAERLLGTYPNEKVGAVTFTRDAAKELRERILRYAGAKAGRRLITGTFHALALEQLQRGSSQRPRILSDAEQRHYMRQAMTMVAPKELQLEAVANGIQAIKSKLHPPTIRPDCVDPVLWVYEAYEKILRDLNVVDFNDLMLMAVHGMRDGKLSPLEVKHLLVDEFQDTDEVQLEWVRCHVNAGVLCTVVGDDDQSIYGFRQAMGYEGMKRFQQFAGASHIPLDITYRCAPEILSAAGNLIANNEQRVAKHLRTRNTSVGRVQLESATNAAAEAALIGDRLSLERDQQWAILARSNRQLDQVEAALTARQLPYQRLGGGSFWDYKGPQIYLCAVRAAAELDAGAMFVILGCAGLSSGALEHLQERMKCAREGGRRLVAGELDNELESMSSGDRGLILDLRKSVADWSQNASRRREKMALYGIQDWLGSHLQRRYLNIDLGICTTALQRMKGSLLQRLQNVRLPSEESKNAKITLMTMHAAKGLEFDRVWVIGVEEGIMPHKDSTVDEERRLLYVAMTRARAELVMSYTTTDDSGHRYPSTFLAECGLDTSVLQMRDAMLVASPAEV